MQERRESVLTDADVEKIRGIFEKIRTEIINERTAWAESIGYDVSTPDSRVEIRKDHEFIRSTRRARAKIIASFLMSIGGFFALFLWNAFKAIVGKS